MRRIWLALCLVLAAASLTAQVPGAPGRTTGPKGGGTFSFSIGFGAISCSGSTCSDTSGTVSPGSQVVSGPITFNAAHNAALSLGGLFGGGAGLMEVSCDGGSTWLTTVSASGTVGGVITYMYPPPSCTGPTNLNTLLFRAVLGGGGASSFNMTFDPPTSVLISW